MTVRIEQTRIQKERGAVGCGISDDPAGNSVSGWHYRLFVRLETAHLGAVFAVTKKRSLQKMGRRRFR